jgi:hypothetical protein
MLSTSYEILLIESVSLASVSIIIRATTSRAEKSGFRILQLMHHQKTTQNAPKRPLAEVAGPNPA